MTKELIQFITSILGSIGFSILFNVRGRKLLLASIGGGIAYITFYIGLQVFENIPVSIFLATAMAGILAEIFARVYKTPVIILLVPMIIPLIPGGDLYYAMNFIIFGDIANFNMKIQLVMQQTASIAGGIIIVSFLTQFILKLKSYIKNPGF